MERKAGGEWGVPDLRLRLLPKAQLRPAPRCAAAAGAGGAGRASGPGLLLPSVRSEAQRTFGDVPSQASSIPYEELNRKYWCREISFWEDVAYYITMVQWT